MFKGQQQIKPALRRGSLAADYNRAVPAYSAENVKRINLGLLKQRPPREMPAEPARQQPAAQPMYAQPRTTQPQPVYAQPRTTQPQPARSIPRPAPAPAAPPAVQLPMPRLEHEVMRGQKTALDPNGTHTKLRVCFGWQLNRGDCDPDASAFLLTGSGKVAGDDWFVFYGQPKSPDGAVSFRTDGHSDLEVLEIDLERLNRAVSRIVFVVTINEAMEKNHNFSMLRDLYVRVLDAGSGRELVSFRPDGCFTGVTSMTVCELYLHNGQWKFNPVGNGVREDLAGQCAVYGVDIG